MDDAILRQMAIDAVETIGYIATMPDGDKCIRRSAVKYTLSMLPSAQPNIVRCKDCKSAEERGCALFCGFWTRYTAHKGYCFKAERRTDEQT